MARADSRRSRLRIKRVAKTLYSDHRVAKLRQGATALKASFQMAVFTAELFGSVTLLFIALWLHL